MKNSRIIFKIIVYQSSSKIRKNINIKNDKKKRISL